MQGSIEFPQWLGSGRPAECPEWVESRPYARRVKVPASARIRYPGRSARMERHGGHSAGSARRALDER
jgi:hypothetical protein